MPVRSALHCLIALLALVVSEPFHEWIHGEHGVEHSGQQEIHDGSCEHFPDHRADDDCLLCIKGHGQAIVLARSVVSTGALAPARAQRSDAPCGFVSNPLLGILGARAPPALG